VRLLVLLGVLAVLCVAAVVAAGRGGGLADAEPDRSPWAELPEDVTSDSLRSLRFSIAFRGYRMDQVDAALDRLATELDRRDQRIAALEGSPSSGGPAGGDSQATSVDTGPT